MNEGITTSCIGVINAVQAIWAITVEIRNLDNYTKYRLIKVICLYWLMLRNRFGTGNRILGRTSQSFISSSGSIMKSDSLQKTCCQTGRREEKEREVPKSKGKAEVSFGALFFSFLFFVKKQGRSGSWPTARMGPISEERSKFFLRVFRRFSKKNFIYGQKLYYSKILILLWFFS